MSGLILYSTNDLSETVVGAKRGKADSVMILRVVVGRARYGYRA